jgi:aerobic carbon-monoxide dehydrogenase medium subunit
VALHTASSSSAAYMGGGIDLMAALKTGAGPDNVIHLGLLPGWNSIVEHEKEIVLSAGTTHQELADAASVRSILPTLCDVWSKVANNRIRVKGTVAGNLMARNQSYDFPIAAIASGAELEFLDRHLALRRVGADRTAELPHGALLTSITLPRVRSLAFVVQLQWKPIVAFALSFRREQDVAVGRLVVGCGYASMALSTVRLDHCLFENSARETPVEIAERLCSSLPSPLSDWRASSEYRRHILKVLVRREIEKIRAAGPSDED